ncbi:MAG: MEDS domain-containing protein [Actinobacteria bacterium]|nr:MEDS domain-containing protein [Actinomycetota bacterium]
MHNGSRVGGQEEPPTRSSDQHAQIPRRDLSLSVLRESDAVVVPVNGDLDLAGSARLGAVLADLIDGQGNRSVVVDLEHVTTIDPAVVGVFAAAATVAECHGGHLALRGSSQTVRDILEAAGLADAVTVVGESEDPPRDDQTPARSRTTVASACGRSNAGGCGHVVEFYESHQFLAESVRDYMVPALRGDDAVIIVATPHHRDLFDEVLRDAGIDVDAARAAGRYIDLDAEETLSIFMVDGQPSSARFDEAIGSLISQATAGGRTVRIYGEMVAVLWMEGNPAAAIALEDLWNDLGRSREFSLFCAYQVSAFDDLETSGSLRRICQQHSFPANPIR